MNLCRFKRLYNKKCDISHINHIKRNYGILELEQKFGKNFEKIQSLNLETATPLEKKMHTFITKIQKSPTINDTVIIHDSEIVATPDEDTKSGQAGKAKPNMQKIIQSSYNWNPYYGRHTKKNDEMQHDHLDVIPEEYKQSGWGMQPAPITGSPQTHKMFPNKNVLKNMITDGQRVHEMGHLLTNPLKDLGYRDANIAKGRDFNVIERALEPYSTNIVEEWHGLQAIESQKEKNVPTDDGDEADIYNLSKKQILMKRLKKNAQNAYLMESSLPPFKYGFEDIPVFVFQRNYHAPDKLGDAKRTRELPAKMSVFLKYIYPNMTKAQSTAIQLIVGGGGKNKKRYNPKTTELRFYCTNHYFYEQNEKQIIEWISKLIAEIDRFAQFIENNHGDHNNVTWEEYKKIYIDEWQQDEIRKKWNKYRWKQKMLSLPPHIRSNYNLYCNGNRMNKLTNYLDIMYNRAFIDAGNILQRQGPKKGTATEYFKHYIPEKHNDIQCGIDNLPANPSEYILNKQLETNNKPKYKFKIINIEKQSKRKTFGVNSCYTIPSYDKIFQEKENMFDMPLAQPFTGLRLRKFKFTPWSNASMLKIYRSRKQSRLGMKLIFGDEHLKKSTVARLEEIEKDNAAQKDKLKKSQMAAGRQRQRRKFAAQQHILEQKEAKRRQNQQKEAQEEEDNPFFVHLSDKKIAKQFKTSVSDISK